MTFRQTIKSLDWILLSSAALIMLFGFAMLLSAAGTADFISPLFIRQAAAAGIGLGALVIIAKIPYHTWKRYAPILYGLGVASLLLVTVVGSVIRGTISRLEVFGVQIQPSEFVKIALVLALAWMLTRLPRTGWRQVFLTGLVAIPPIVLVASEPDLGVAALICVLWIGLLVFQGLPSRHVILLALIGLLVAAAGWHWFLLDYQKGRILTFINPAADPLAAGYSINQSIIALGSGQLIGRGLGHGPQSQLKFLPEQHTDFILASIGEELGFIGLSTLIILYAVVLWRLLIIARTTQDTFGQLIAIGVFLVLLTSFTVSVGMNMGLLPVTGVPLPLVSYGGSNLVATLILLGLAQSVWVYSHFMRRAPSEISGFN